MFPGFRLPPAQTCRPYEACPGGRKYATTNISPLRGLSLPRNEKRLPEGGTTNWTRPRVYDFRNPCQTLIRADAPSDTPPVALPQGGIFCVPPQYPEGLHSSPRSSIMISERGLSDAFPKTSESLRRSASGTGATSEQPLGGFANPSSNKCLTACSVLSAASSGNI